MSYTRISAKKIYGVAVCEQEKVKNETLPPLASGGDLKLSNFAEVMCKRTMYIVICGVFFSSDKL